MARVFALSDLHVDFADNMQQMMSLSDHEYADDVLLVAGDVSDRISRLSQLLGSLKRKFRKVAFVPGNHELWLRDDDSDNSLEKFSRLLALCEQLGVHTEPFKVGQNDRTVWIVPLYSWYRTEDADEFSLVIPKEGERWEKCLWMDKYRCRWPESLGADAYGPADYFLALNKEKIERRYDAPIISFSHFLPRKELIFEDPAMVKRFCEKDALIPRSARDPAPMFNFTRVAGCKRLDLQIRALGATVHVYGHQHRHRNRKIDGITYVSNCLGYAREREHLGAQIAPKLLWKDGVFVEPAEVL